ncbi:hypothetical protein [Calorimonas adulescens]|jgi:hypothetical protein|uniref:Uncharacterized protein n=1 Tax=Calorimonas adulescens TaxID=2606906 RepID=A0A5D8Q949_9THEO|nr:hypothetical protein [Calorimonas adulescens]TZE81022.1 hypothetical protein FWJ32_11000 [Calorimonas adulescens]
MLTKTEIMLFNIFSWLPVFSIAAAAFLFIWGIALKHKGKQYRKLFVAGGIFLGLFLLWWILFIIIGLIGFGPGRFD